MTRLTPVNAVMAVAAAAIVLVWASPRAGAQAVPPGGSAAAAPAAAASPAIALGGPQVSTGPRVVIDLGGDGEGGLAGPLKIILVLALVTLAPTLILTATSFTRIIIVTSLLRQAVGVAQLPPGRVLVGLALFLTMFTMAPVASQIYTNAIVPYEAGELDEGAALEAGLKPLRRFMLRQTREEDLALFMRLMNEPKPQTAEDVPTLAAIPAFLLSELKTGFQMGALLFIPFLVIDLVVAAVLMSMGMMMIPPVTISLPLKIIAFVLFDGWGLVVESLATSFVG